ncbi:cytochrome P450 [Streptomyces sp. SLBN-31]|uniref:cytochrome P450 n=1 Tax=Streptomyces sp. SLBN-31 TaxID=2768444 RepID=UPI00114F3EA4|nr:cytochrome P450 [Streptomyces sp. SLBN-31]TQJ85413.1 pentalenene oxygenase [Streptomyces sp. SLBN-31]
MSAPTAAPIPTPTAPGRLPLIGHGLRLVRDPLPFIASLREHGSVVRIRIGPTPAYVVTDPALARRVLVTDAAHFPKGGKYYDALRVFLGDGVATVADGDTHLRNRRLMQPMFSKAHIAERGNAMIEQVRTMVSGWPAHEPRDMFAGMNEITLATFLVAVFGADLPAHLEGEFTALMPEIMRGTIRQVILPPWISRLPLPANRAHTDRVARLRALIDQAIDHHTAPRGSAWADGTSGPASEDGATGTEACPHTSEARRQQGGLFKTLIGVEDQLGRRQLQDEAITLLAGAIETTGTTLAWALYEIARNPAIERRLREELASVCEDRPLRYHDLDQLPYGRRVLQEAIRKYGVSWMVTRTTARDIVLGGHLIPEGADVVWSPYLHQHDPAYYPDPDTFDPDRWETDRAAATRGSFLAFGDGRRKCIGENFAWVELQIILATILQLWPRFEMTSRPPRAQAVITVKPDALTMEFHSDSVG